MGRNTRGIASGVLVVLFGAFLLLLTTDTVEDVTIGGVIAGIFVLWGLWLLIRSRFRRIVFPVMLIAIAGAFGLRSLGYLEPGTISTWWPLFIVLFGVLLLIRRLVIPSGEPQIVVEVEDI